MDDIDFDKIRLDQNKLANTWTLNPLQINAGLLSYISDDMYSWWLNLILNWYAIRVDTAVELLELNRAYLLLNNGDTYLSNG